MAKRRFKYELIILTAIIIFGLFLRVYSLGSPPLWIDESISTIASEKIVQTGLPIFDSGITNSRAYTFHYLQAFFLLFSSTDFAARFISVIFGLLTIILIYLFAKEYKTSALIPALLLSIFFLEVFYSRQARMYQMFQFFFFLTIYLLYKAKNNPKLLYWSIASFFITIDTQLEGLILAPLMTAYILLCHKKHWFLSILPSIPFLRRLILMLSLSTKSSASTLNYLNRYTSYTLNMTYMLILFVPGLIYSYIKNKRLTLLIITPSIITLLGVLSLKTFALRYSYFFVFPLILYSGILFSYLLEKYGKIMLISIILIVIVPSNIFFPHTYVNIISPIDYAFNDASAPATNYKALPDELVSSIKQNTLVSYFSSDVEWYLKKPDYVLPFSMDGRGSDSISRKNSKGIMIDVYSGAPILNFIPNSPYHVTADRFSTSKLSPIQRKFLEELVGGCEKVYVASDLIVWFCK